MVPPFNKVGADGDRTATTGGVPQEDTYWLIGKHIIPPIYGDMPGVGKYIRSIVYILRKKIELMRE